MMEPLGTAWRKPSGERAGPGGGAAGGSTGSIGCPSVADQASTLFWRSQAKICLPCGPNATLCTSSRVPLEGENCRTRFRDPHLRLVRTSGDDPLAVGAERHALHHARVLPESVGLVARLRVPHLRRLVPTAGDDPP